MNFVVFDTINGWPISIFLNLVFAHFLCDFALQNDKMAVEKCPGRDVTLPWYWWLTAHSATHGLAVSLITGIPLFGILEMGMHFLLDYSKCRFRLSLAFDQAGHIFCKFLWASLLVWLRLA